MSLPLLTLPLLLLHAASVSPATVPARGAQEAILTLDRAGRYIVKAQSPAGTACEIVDHVRGPFEQSGQVGRSSCELDLLLDAGTYKLRLSSKRKGKGNVALSVTPYTELNPAPVRLLPRREVKQSLKPRQQASYWLKIDERQPVTLRIAGRHAGDVRLWRSGEWLEPLAARDTGPRPHPGQPIHEWWFEATLEPGVYLLTAYGTASTAWTQSDTADSSGLTVTWGFPMASEDRIATFTLPETGLATLEFPSEPAAFFLSREGASKSTTHLSLHPMGEDGSTNVFSSAESTCEIDGKALVPECSASSNEKRRRVALIRGEPGAHVTLRWARLLERYWEDGVYGSGAQSLRFDVAKEGDYLVAIHETPLDQDNVPVGCALSEVLSRGDTRLQRRELLQVGPDTPFRRSFNYNGNSATLQFEITRSGRYVFQTAGERKTRCELFRYDGDKLTRLTETQPEAKTCRVAVPATAGLYELRLYGGTEGIENVTLAVDGPQPQGDTPTKVSCLFPKMHLGSSTSYVLTSTRSSERALRGLFVRPLPLTLSEPMALVLDGRKSVKLPLGGGRPVEIRALNGEAFSCALGDTKLDAKGGTCALPGNAGELTIENPGLSAITLSLRRPSPPPPAPPPLVAFNPNLAPLPVLAPSTPMWLDFDRGEDHSLTFDVKDAGLYHVTTEGLLSTQCRIRTPVVQEVGAATGGGRGRNCLVSSYLRPGRYLLDVRTVGQSRGRGAVLLERRSVKSAEGLSGEAEVFFRAEAGDLIQQKLRVPKRAEYTLSTAAQSGSLQCRLDDPQGWPVVKIPAPCTSTMFLVSGNYLWTQLPLTVESMRRTSLERVRPTVTLKGNAVHPLPFNAWSRVALGKDGKDEFSFEVPAKLEVAFALTHGMQGRLYQVGADNQLKPVETIAAMTPELTRPQASSAPRVRAYVPPPPAPEETESSGEEGEGANSDEERPPGRDYQEEESPPEPSEESQESSDSGQAAASAEPLPETDAPAPVGRVLSLEPGRYRLITEHSRGDVAITYAIYLRVDTLAPGIVRAVNAPASIPLRLPAEGTLRLSSKGDTDVRCRIFDSEGRLVVENADRGADWNCAIAEPFAAGDYTLVLESQTQQPGPTRISVAVAKVTDAGVLADKATLKLDAGVQRATLPAQGDNGVQEVALRAKTPISCALEDDKGAVVTRQLDTRECMLLVRPGGATWRVRVWTLANSAQVTTALVTHTVTPSSGGGIAPAVAALTKIPQAGRYQTGAGLYCLPAGQKGPLERCSGEVSLEAGEWIFSGAGGQEASLKLNEVVDALDGPKTERVRLTRSVSLLRQSTRSPALHLFKATVQVGDRSNPACALVGGTARQDDFMCVAATGPTEHSLARWWTPALSATEASVTRLAVPVPSAAGSLQPGLQNLVWSQGTALQLRMPTSPTRVQLALPRNAWAVQVDEQGTAVDLCAPAQALAACVLTGKGGSIVVYSPEESRTQAEVVAIDPTPRRENLERLYEAVSSAPAQQSLVFTAQAAPRLLTVSGALRCVTTLDDGTRLEGCEAKVPAGRSGEVVLDVGVGGVRAVLTPPAELRSAALGTLAAQAGADLPAARALKLSGSRVERSFTLASDAAVHVRSDSGVCGVVQGTTVIWVQGSDKGCAVRRGAQGRQLPPDRPWLRGPDALRRRHLDAGAGEGAEGRRGQRGELDHSLADALLPVLHAVSGPDRPGPPGAGGAARVHRARSGAAGARRGLPAVPAARQGHLAAGDPRARKRAAPQVQACPRGPRRSQGGDPRGVPARLLPADWRAPVMFVSPRATALLALLAAFPVAAQDYRPADESQRPEGGSTRILPEQFLRGFDPVTVYFSGNEGPGKRPADDGAKLLKITPSWPGQYFWADKKTLQFRPAEPWPPLQRFAFEVRGDAQGADDDDVRAVRDEPIRGQHGPAALPHADAHLPAAAAAGRAQADAHAGDPRAAGPGGFADSGGEGLQPLAAAARQPAQPGGLRDHARRGRARGQAAPVDGEPRARRGGQGALDGQALDAAGLPPASPSSAARRASRWWAGRRCLGTWRSRAATREICRSSSSPPTWRI